MKSLPEGLSLIPASPLGGQLTAFPAEALRLKAPLFSILSIVDMEQHLQISQQLGET